MTSLLQLSNIGFNYGDRKVLANISLSLNKGSCTALVGPNGVGKTTLLRIAAGTLEPASGGVLLEGKPLAGMPRKERSRIVALVPQQLDISFDFTVQQIVEQGRTPYLGLLRGPLRADRIAVDRALDLADVSGLRNRIFNELSGGERQRVKIALGLAQQPKLLLLDEPTQNLDIGRQTELLDLLHHLREQGITIFVSIHDLHLVHHNFAEVHLLDSCQSLISGTPDQVLTPMTLANAFRCAPGRHPLLMEKPLTQDSL
jgi:ABC-type cobalamin/Fe3+-siderophores transport system ATPase subunit